MGVDLGELIKSSKKVISLDELSGYAIAIDAYNAIHQFLAIIRGRMGEPLKDRAGRVTSHLSGILYRTTNLIEMGLKPVFVFDGIPPPLKETEIKHRLAVKKQAQMRYEEALIEGDMERARRYAQMTSRVKEGMIKDAKMLLDLMGIPWVQAPSEGEAQAAYMAFKGDVWAAASQDYDSLLFNSPKLVRNLTITGRRKLPGRSVYIEVEPEIIEVSTLLLELGLTREQLIDLGILIGTDFNPEGVKGVGPKTALKLVKEHGKIEEIEKVKPELKIPSNYGQIRRIFLVPPTLTDYNLEWGEPDTGELVGFLCDERDFSEPRVKKALDRIEKRIKKKKGEKTLESYFNS